MKNKVVWLVIAAVLVVSMLLATMTACPAEVTQTTTQQTTTIHTTVTSTAPPDQIIWRYQCYNMDAESWDYKGAVEMSDLIYEETDGGLKIDVFLGGQLGYTGFEMYQAVVRGMLDGGHAASSHLGAENPAFEVINMPLIFDEVRHDPDNFMPDIALREAEPLIQRMCEDMNLYWGGACVMLESMITKVPLATVADWDGIKLRAYAESQAKFYEAMGAVPTIIPFSEYYSAVQTGVVVGGGGGAASLKYAKLYEVAEYIDRWPTTYIEVDIWNKQSVESLPEEWREVFEKYKMLSTQRTQEYDSVELELWLLDQLPIWGMTDIRPTIEEVRAGRELVRPVLWDPVLEAGGDDAEALLEIFLEVQGAA